MNDNTQLQTGGLSQEWQERLAASAKEQAATEQTPGNFFSTKGGILTFQNMALPGNKMEVVILIAMHERVFYATKFDANTAASPSCYGYSYDGKDMTPHAEAEQPQSLACATCRQDAWGSDPNGKGKACREIRRLCVIPASSIASPEAVLAATAGMLRVPIMSVTKQWSPFVTALAAKGLPTFAVVTEISVVADPRSMFRIEFKPVRPVDNPAILGTLVERIAREKQSMMTPYPKRANPQQGANPSPVPASHQTGHGPMSYGPAPTAAAPQQTAPVFGSAPPPVKF